MQASSWHIPMGFSRTCLTLRWNTIHHVAPPSARHQPCKCLLVTGCSVPLDIHFIQNIISQKQRPRLTDGGCLGGLSQGALLSTLKSHSKLSADNHSPPKRTVAIRKPHSPSTEVDISIAYSWTQNSCVVAQPLINVAQFPPNTNSSLNSCLALSSGQRETLPSRSQDSGETQSPMQQTAGNARPTPYSPTPHLSWDGMGMCLQGLGLWAAGLTEAPKCLAAFIRSPCCVSELQRTQEPPEKGAEGTWMLVKAESAEVYKKDTMGIRGGLALRNKTGSQETQVQAEGSTASESQMPAKPLPLVSGG